MNYYQENQQSWLLRGGLVLVILAMIVWLPGQAQSVKGGATNKVQAKVKRQPSYYPETLKVQPTLPYMELYKGQGAVVSSGTTFPGLIDQHVYRLHCEAKEDARRVLNWYRSSLESNGWKVQSKPNDEKSLMALREKEGLSVVVVTKDTRTPGYGCTYSIRYVENMPETAEE